MHRRLFRSFAAVGTAALAIATGTAAATDSITINEPGGYGVDQDEAMLCATSEGALLIFRDSRDGRNPTYRCRMIDQNGMTVGTSVSLESAGVPTERISSGFVTGNRTGSAMFIFRLFDTEGLWLLQIDPATGTPIADAVNILLDEPNLTTYLAPKIALDDDGNILVLFGSGHTLLGRLYDSAFQSLGSSFLIGEELSGNYVDSFANVDGSFTVGWKATVHPDYFEVVRSQRFSVKGTELGPENTHTVDQTFFGSFKLGGCEDGSCLIAWHDTQAGNRIISQKIGSDGVAVGDLVVLVGANSFNAAPGGIFGREDGTWAVVQDRSNYSLSFASVGIFDDDLAAMGSPKYVPIDDLPYSAFLSDTDSVLICWREDALTQLDIMGSTLALESGEATAAARLADDVDGADQYRPGIASNATGTTLVAWIDERNGHREVYAQRYASDGSALGGNTFVGDCNEKGDTNENMPQVAINARGEAVILFWDYIDDTLALIAQRLDANSGLVGSPINVTEGTGYDPADNSISGVFEEGNASAALFDDGSFIVAWNTVVEDTSGFGDDVDIVVRGFDATGAPQMAGASMVNVSIDGETEHYLFGIITRPDQTAKVVYGKEPRYEVPGTPGVYDRDIAGDGMPMDSPRFLAFSWYVDDYSIAGNQHGYSIAWGSGVVDHIVYSRHYDAEGNLLSNDAMTTSRRTNGVAIAHDGSRFVIHRYAYSASGTGDTHYNWYAMRYTNEGNLVGGSQLVLHTDQAPYQYNYPNWCMSGSRLLGSYSDPSLTDQGWDAKLTTTEYEICDMADYNCDGFINGQDLAWLLGFWGLPTADITGDGITDGADLTLLLGSWS